MKRKVILFVVAVLFIINILPAEEPGKVSISVQAGALFPLTTSTETRRFTMGLSTGLNIDYVLSSLPFFFIHSNLDYDLLPTIAEHTLSTLGLSVGPGFILNSRIITFKASASGGYYLSFYRGLPAVANPYVQTELGFGFNFNSKFNLGIGGSYNAHFQRTNPLYHGPSVFLGGTFTIGSTQTKSNLKIDNINILPVFPVFFKYYDTNQIGEITLQNGEKGLIKDVTVSLFVQDYMNNPKVCGEYEIMEKGEERVIPLYALFTEEVMGITEATMTQAEIIVEYTYKNQELQKTEVQSIRMFDRNAMTWDDDRKAASFVTSKDPLVLRITKNVAGLVREQVASNVNLNFKIAIGLFESVRLYGVSYVVDPKTPYAEFSTNATALDFLQFPRQTLEYKAGDCDDLSILYCSLLESIGIETAFVTAPGHIFMAFSLGITKEEAGKLFSNSADFIYMEDLAWVPVEITLFKDGFLKAWQVGAREWREHNPMGAAGFFPVHQAWSLYEPVGISGTEGEVSFPEDELIIKAVESVLDSFIRREIEPRVSKLESQIAESNESPRLINKLGLIYAKYGLYKPAGQHFRRAAEKEYMPAVLNLANIYYLNGDYEGSLIQFKTIYDKQPYNTKAILGLARSYYQLEDYTQVNKFYGQLKIESPELAEKYKFLVSSEKTEERASLFAMVEEMEWSDE